MLHISWLCTCGFRYVFISYSIKFLFILSLSSDMASSGSLFWKQEELHDLQAHHTIHMSILPHLYKWHYLFGSVLKKRTVSSLSLRHMSTAALEHSRYLTYTLNSLVWIPFSCNLQIFIYKFIDRFWSPLCSFVIGYFVFNYKISIMYL